jgi:transposase-like protein
MGQHRGRDEWARLVAEYEQVAETQSLRAFSKDHDIHPKSLRYWINKRRDEALLEQQQRLVPVVVRPGAAVDGVAVVVRLGAEPTVEILDPARAPAAWVTELLRELSKGAA